MPVPKKRHTNSRQGKRRGANYRLFAKELARCSACGAAILPHRACPACGSYKGRQVVKIKPKTKKEKGKK